MSEYYKSYSLSCDLPRSRETEYLLASMNEAYEAEKKSIEDSLNALRDEFLSQQGKLSADENFNRWLTAALSETLDWALKAGWNACYDYHKKRIEDGEEGGETR